MSEDVKVALIAGAVALLVSTVGFLSTRIALQEQQKEFGRNLQSAYTERLYSLRLEYYPLAFTLTEQIQYRPHPQGIVNREDLQHIAQELYSWKTGTVSLIISKQTLDRFYELRDALSMNYGQREGFTRDQVEKIMNARNEFRRSLRKDVGLIHEGLEE
jgi:hypothetical protein